MKNGSIIKCAGIASFGNLTKIEGAFGLFFVLMYKVGFAGKKKPVLEVPANRQQRAVVVMRKGNDFPVLKVWQCFWHSPLDWSVLAEGHRQGA